MNKNKTPRLDALRQQLRPPTPPEGYLEQLTDTVMQRTRHLEAATTRRVPLWGLLRIAASLLLLLAAGWWWLHTPAASPAPGWGDLPPAALETYVNAHIDEFDWEWLLEANSPIAAPAYELTPEEMHDYLENNLDEDWLEEELF